MDLSIRELAEAVFAITPMAKGGEFSVEIDPNEIDEPRLDALAEVGMNRASIGVQDSGAGPKKPHLASWPSLTGWLHLAS